jgi:hypothetical protein
VKTTLPRLATALVLAVTATAMASAPAIGAVDPSQTLIRPVAKLGRDGRTVRITGQVVCATCTRVTLAVTVSQRSGALAQGGLRCLCRAATETWTITARVRTAGAVLHAGHARICAWVIAFGPRAKPIDAYQWCRVARVASPNSAPG